MWVLISQNNQINNQTIKNHTIVLRQVSCMQYGNCESAGDRTCFRCVRYGGARLHLGSRGVQRIPEEPEKPLIEAILDFRLGAVAGRA